MEMTIIWTDVAIEELQAIFDYHLLKASKKIALKLTDSIVDKTLTLEHSPRIGSKEELLKAS